MRFGPPCRPPWWPQNEPWPPRYAVRRKGPPFVRRMAFAVFLFVTLGMTGLLTLAGLMAPSAAVRMPPILFAVVAAAVAVGFVGLIAAVQRVALPLGGLMDAAERVAAGDYDARVGERGSPRLREFARAFNTMTTRLQDNDRIRRDLMADIAHELRTPLSIIQGKLEGLADGVYPRDDAQIEQLLEQTRVLSRLVDDMRTLALTESGSLKLQREASDVAALVRDAAASATADAAARHVSVVVDVAGDIHPLEIDPVRIREVISNLLSNAIRHTPAGGRITVRAEGLPDGSVSIEVRDTGSGMTSEELAHAFDRFYRGKQSRGSGLGLAIARNFVVAHGGTIDATSAPGAGTTIRFRLPATPLP